MRGVKKAQIGPEEKKARQGFARKKRGFCSKTTGIAEKQRQRACPFRDRKLRGVRAGRGGGTATTTRESAATDSKEIMKKLTNFMILTLQIIIQLTQRKIRNTQSLSIQKQKKTALLQEILLINYLMKVNQCATHAAIVRAPPRRGVRGERPRPMVQDKIQPKTNQGVQHRKLGGRRPTGKSFRFVS